MATFLGNAFVLSTLLRWVAAQGVFTVPASTNQTFTVGAPLQVAWTGGQTYTELSLGIFETSNPYIYWLLCMSSYATHVFVSNPYHSKRRTAASAYNLAVVRCQHRDIPSRQYY